MMDKLIVGLGNPGRKYAKSKHNAGFMAIDAFAKLKKVKFSKETKFQGEVAETETAILLKPKTFMNLSGNSVKAVSQYYRIPAENILVISDDVDLPFGKIRLREKGGAGGHNGLKSIIEQLGKETFKRLRIGVDRNDEMDMKDHVLSGFAKAQMKELADLMITTTRIIDEYATGLPFPDLMSKYN